LKLKHPETRGILSSSSLSLIELRTAMNGAEIIKRYFYGQKGGIVLIPIRLDFYTRGN